ncbi:Panacea domain-containing protein [Micrococcus lylae]|uniref:DUF4065 domain-containing protein n=1 Tax=Micrococcus lylae TaxID=1273 RepID=A0ABY2JWI0_9MICC|nr:type II toxin-antitoxin system antitoxin SocA domain-containing protein [Micrococcus lylae]TFH97814.1 DUF4065 domain-containing protein [Micrococcus lylae]WIK82563.1 DUF4065 domain-containing protein [Micrococcus lylae]
MTTATTVQDVAAYILEKSGPMTAMKLQKLCYYSLAWHMTWEDRALFPERVQAWANGPVIVDLYAKHRGQFMLDAPWDSGDSSALDDGERSSIDAVLSTYGKFTASQLSDMTHREKPWIDARAGVAEGARSRNEITLGAIHEYYSGL